MFKCYSESDVTLLPKTPTEKHKKSLRFRAQMRQKSCVSSCNGLLNDKDEEFERLTAGMMQESDCIDTKWLVEENRVITHIETHLT